ncbi:MAG: hypothetical protein R2875_10350 [Desulfobacterales bacterium]
MVNYLVWRLWWKKGSGWSCLQSGGHGYWQTGHGPLSDAATLVVGTPTVLAGPHPYAAYAVFLANALKPRVKFLSIVGSYGWGGKTVGNPCRHDPQSQRWRCWTRSCAKGGNRRKRISGALSVLADTIAQKHAENGFQ